MKRPLFKRRLFHSPSCIPATCLFITGFLVCFLVLPNPERSISTAGERYVTPISTTGRSFFHAWRHSPETCPEWLSVQRGAKSYLDAYVVGSQKGATSQMSKHLFELGVRHKSMVKEWHYFSTLDENGDVIDGRTAARPLPPLEIEDLRLSHYLQGFPDANLTGGEIPLVDDRPIDKRLLVIDMTVEYLHSDRSAFLAHALTPHAKIIITVRDPVERALSQYNMNVRNGNRNHRKAGREDTPATPQEFHKKIQMEIEKLSRCGYNAESGALNRKTSELAACLFSNATQEHFDDTMYVTRGLYHLHIQTWRDHFPSHRIMVVSFQDMAMGKRSVYNDLTQFLCIRPYPESLLTKYEAQGSSLSFGQQAAKHGLEKAGFDSYLGNDRYLSEMYDETRQLMRKFYTAADRHLVDLLGSDPVYWVA